MDKNHVFMSRVPLDLSFVFAIQNYLRMQGNGKKRIFSIRKEARMTPQLNDKQSLIAQIEQKDVLFILSFENIKSFTNLLFMRQQRDDSGRIH